jgi:hypothetical protein
VFFRSHPGCLAAIGLPVSRRVTRTFSAGQNRKSSSGRLTLYSGQRRWTADGEREANRGGKSMNSHATHAPHTLLIADSVLISWVLMKKKKISFTHTHTHTHTHSCVYDIGTYKSLLRPSTRVL